MSRIRATGADFIAPRYLPVVIVTSVINAYRHDTPLYIWIVNNYWAYRILSMLGKVESIASDIPLHMNPDSLANGQYRRRIKELLRVKSA